MTGGGELSNEVIVVDGKDEEIPGLDEPIHEEVVPDQGVQQQE